MTSGGFLGWRVVAASTIGLGCGLGTLVAATFGVFLGPLQREFSWAQSEVLSALLVVTITASFLAPIVGAVVDRFGARRIILASFVAEMLIVGSLAFQSDDLWTFYLRFFLLAAFTLGTTHVAFARVLTVWFDRRRGLALGIALSGIGIGGFIWPLYAQFMIGEFGWRNAYLLLAAAVAVFALPVIFFWLKDTPQSVGQWPDGDTAAAVDRSAKVSSAQGMTLWEASRTRQYWLMIVTFFLIGFVVQSIILHLVPLLTGRGVSPMRAALAQSVLFLALTSGRLVTGWLMDRFFAPRVALAFLIAPIVGIVMLALGVSEWLAVISALLVGLAVGAEVDVLAYLTGRYFGARHFAAVYGSFYGIYSLSGGIGPFVTALAVERFGGYTPVLLAHSVVLVLCCGLLLRFAAFPNRPQGSA
ncbi:MAG: MFS transporter [Gammaproteobacteria bacterium]|nr:MFS transporter [Gammaproteobacteria bacterium]